MVTGHRPSGLYGYDEAHPGTQWIKHALCYLVRGLRAANPEARFVSGMALGVDTWFAEAVLAAGSPLEAYIPFRGQESKWPYQSRARYQRLLAPASQVHVVSRFGYEDLVASCLRPGP